MKWLRGLRTLLFLNCRQAAQLISRAMDRQLGVQDYAALRTHLFICPHCRRYNGQLTLLRRAMVLVHASQLRSAEPALSPPARARIALHLAQGEDDA
jgi:hypothetical protein